LRCKRTAGLVSGGERRSQLRRRVGPVTRTRRVIASAVLVVSSCILECALALAAEKDAITPVPTLRQLQAVEQDHAASPPGPRGNDARAPARSAGSTSPTSPKTRAPAQSPTTQPKPPAPAATSNSTPPHEAEPVFPALPAASRARLRDCGREWQEMKRTGQAKELTWRDFATRCLAR
jgi:hypothetical protein